MNINYNKSNRTISVSDIFVNKPIFNKIGDIYILSLSNLQNIIKLNLFSSTNTNSNNYRYLTKQYRISRDGITYTNWFDLDISFSNFPIFDSKYKLFIDIKWIRGGDSNIGIISLIDYKISGIYDTDSLVDISIPESFNTSSIPSDVVPETTTINLASVDLSNISQTTQGIKINKNPTYRTITISDSYTNNVPIFLKLDDTYVLSFINLTDIKKLISFSYNTSGANDNRYLTTQYRISKDGNLFSNWLNLDKSFSDFPLLDSKYKLFIDIRWIRKGDSNIGNILLLDYLISGLYDGDVVVDNFSSNNNQILQDTSYNFSQQIVNTNIPPNNLIIIGASSSLQGTQGLQGNIGPTGSQGKIGPIGPIGNQGNIGPQGRQGFRGYQGHIGDQGVIGPQGFDGQQGPRGYGLQGGQGPQGFTGSQGFQGPTGPQGFQGSGVQGATGSQGFSGIDGTQGSVGPQGFKGFQGFTGQQGFGFQGFQGFQGFTGDVGDQGPIGVQGVQGFQGFKGGTGSQGFQGNQGITGSQGFKGATGSQGFQGFVGATGTQGPKGATGNTISLTSSYPIMGDGSTSSPVSLNYTSDFVLSSNALSLNLTSTSFPSLSISRMWLIYKNDGVTQFPTASISSSSITYIMTSSGVTIPTGCKVLYLGTSSIDSIGVGQQAPSSVTGNWVFTPNPPVVYPISSYFTASSTSNSTYTITLIKPATGLVVSGGQVIRASGTNTTSASDTITYNDLFYFGYTSVLGSGNVIQSQVNSLTASSVVNLTNYKFGGKTQTLTSITDSSGNRVIFAYPNSYGNVSNIVLNGAISITSAFLKTTITITTLSGVSVSYNVYVAVADNSYPSSNTLTIT